MLKTLPMESKPFASTRKRTPCAYTFQKSIQNQSRHIPVIAKHLLI